MLIVFTVFLPRNFDFGRKCFMGETGKAIYLAFNTAKDGIRALEEQKVEGSGM